MLFLDLFETEVHGYCLNLTTKKILAQPLMLIYTRGHGTLHRGGNSMAVDTVSEKSKKNDILEAYHQLLKENKDLQKVSRKTVVEQEEKRQIVTKSEQNTPDRIIKDIADLKLLVTKHLEEIGGHIIEERHKLKEIQQAISIEKESLKRKHEMSEQADMLETLLLAQERKRQDFEKERVQFKNEFDEQKTTLLKERKREIEEYNYRLTLERQKDSDQYASKKTALEQELIQKRSAWEAECTERERILKDSESELINLREQVASFPESLKVAIEKATAAAIENLQIEYKFNTKLREQEYTAETKLLKQTIDSCKTKIEEMESLVTQLTQQTNTAGKQVQDIAIRAIEGASGLPNSTHPSAAHNAFAKPAPNLPLDDISEN